MYNSNYMYLTVLIPARGRAGLYLTSYIYPNNCFKELCNGICKFFN
jgi:hypothetical protein